MPGDPGQQPYAKGGARRRRKTRTQQPYRSTANANGKLTTPNMVDSVTNPAT
jgi:hypothetical protein